MTVPGARHNLEAGQEESATSQQIRRYRHNRKNGGNGQKFAGLYTGPYFDPSMPNNVSVQLGDTALLICKVNQVGGKTVSTTTPLPRNKRFKLKFLSRQNALKFAIFL